MAPAVDGARRAHPYYPANLDLVGRRCLVVGGGRVAARKVDGLVTAGALVTVVAPAVGPDLASRSDIIIVRRPYRGGDVAGSRLVVTATDDAAVNAAVAAEAEAAGVWVNSADDPTNCSFVLPAQIRRGTLLVTVSTGGASPALSSWLRRRLEATIGPEYAVLADRLAARRAALHAAGESTEGLDWDAVIASELAGLAPDAEVPA